VAPVEREEWAGFSKTFQPFITYMIQEDLPTSAHIAIDLLEECCKDYCDTMAGRLSKASHRNRRKNFHQKHLPLLNNPEVCQSMLACVHPANFMSAWR
jgi:hypothetical protein